jgi:hypothetical protein
MYRGYVPKNIQLYRVFVASPQDCNAERQRLDKVIHEMNLAHEYAGGIRLELIGWETHSFPEFGSDPQAVINAQIGMDYDVFIGLLWSRIGTPTPRYISGTIEEFNRAYQKWQDSPESVQLMIYFKDEPVSPSQLVLEQIAQIQKFKAELPPAGGIYWVVSSADDFETKVRLHLARVVQKWRTIPPASLPRHVDIDNSQVPHSSVPIDPSAYEEELGFLDYLELTAEAGERHTAALERLTKAVEQVGALMNQRNAEVDTLISNPNLGDAKIVIQETASNLTEFATSTSAEISIMSQAHSDLLRHVAGGAACAIDIGAAGEEQIAELLASLDSLTSSLESASAQLRDLRGTIASIPRMQVALNRAKRRAVDTLDTLDEALTREIEQNRNVKVELLHLHSGLKAT